MDGVDLLAVFFASVVYLLLYFIWYSKFLFGKIYKTLSKQKKGKSFFSYLFIFGIMLMSSYVLAIFEVLIKVTSFWDGVFLGFLIWLGFAFSHSFFLVITYKRNFKLFILDNILYLLGLMIVGGILAG